MAMENFKLSKLVTLCYSSEHQQNAEELETRCKHVGQSRFQTMAITISFPKHPKNLSFYEYFSHPKSLCNRLSFIYVGVMSDNTDFNEYKQVETVEFSEYFSTVKTVFGVIRKLESVIEASFVLNPKNMFLTASDNHVELTAQIRELQKQVKQLNVKTVRIRVSNMRGVERCTKEPKTRFHHILEYIGISFPNLTALYIELENSSNYYDGIEDALLAFSGKFPKLTLMYDTSTSGNLRTLSYNEPQSTVTSTAVSSSSTHFNGVQNINPLVVPSASLAATDTSTECAGTEGINGMLYYATSDEDERRSQTGKLNERNGLQSIKRSYGNGRQDDKPEGRYVGQRGKVDRSRSRDEEKRNRGHGRQRDELDHRKRREEDGRHVRQLGETEYSRRQEGYKLDQGHGRQWGKDYQHWRREENKQYRNHGSQGNELNYTKKWKDGTRGPRGGLRDHVWDYRMRHQDNKQRLQHDKQGIQTGTKPKASTATSTATSNFSGNGISPLADEDWESEETSEQMPPRPSPPYSRSSPKASTATYTATSNFSGNGISPISDEDWESEETSEQMPPRPSPPYSPSSPKLPQPPPPLLSPLSSPSPPPLPLAPPPFPPASLMQRSWGSERLEGQPVNNEFISQQMPNMVDPASNMNEPETSSRKRRKDVQEFPVAGEDNERRPRQNIVAFVEGVHNDLQLPQYDMGFLEGAHNDLRPPPNDIELEEDYYGRPPPNDIGFREGIHYFRRPYPQNHR